MVLPSPSTGVLMAPFENQAVLYDPVAGQVHVLNPTARVVWEACAAGFDHEEVTRALADASGQPMASVVEGVDAYLAQLRAAALVDGRPWDPPVAEGLRLPARRHESAVLGVLDERIVVRCDDAELCGLVDATLSSLVVSDRPSSVEFDVSVDADAGAVHLVGPGVDQHWSSVADLIEALPSVLNQVAAASTSVLALHSGAVVAPTGEAVLLPAVSGAGKTTLTATLVQAGWGYLSDEAVGVRAGSLVALAYAKPLVLDPTSVAAIGLAPRASVNVSVEELRPGAVAADQVSVAAVVLPTFGAGADVEVVELEPVDAFLALAEHALNLRYVGQPGLDALVDLAQRVPVRRLLHPGGAAAVAAVEGLRS